MSRESTPRPGPWSRVAMAPTTARTTALIGTAEAARILRLSVDRTRELDDVLLPERAGGRRIYRLDVVERLARERARR